SPRRIALRLFLAVWLRTPVHGSTPFATCWSQLNASGSDFTSQYAMRRPSTELHAVLECRAKRPDDRALKQARLGIWIGGGEALGLGVVGRIHHQKAAAWLGLGVEQCAGMHQLGRPAFQIGQMLGPGGHAQVQRGWAIGADDGK